MLLSFSIKNMYSYQNKTIMDLAPRTSGSKKLNSNSIFSFKESTIDQQKKKHINTFRVPNVHFIYGANASGKSNLILALQSLKQFVTDDGASQTANIELFRVHQFKFQKNRHPIELGISILTEIDQKKVKINYQIRIDSSTNAVVYECVTVQQANQTLSNLDFNFGKQQLIIERNDNQFVNYAAELIPLVQKYEPQDFQATSLVSLFIKNINSEYFSESITTFAYKVLKELYVFFDNEVVFLNHSNDVRRKNVIADKLRNDPDFKSESLTALQRVDFSIKDLKLRDITADLLRQYDDVFDQMDQSVIERLKTSVQSRSNYSIEPVHELNGDEYTLNYEDESAGTLKFISDFLDIFEAMNSGRVVFMDEIERNYHPLIQNYILDMFLDSESQLITTTHNPMFLDDDRLAKEQFMFVEKNRKTQASDLYMLSDFDGYSNDNYKLSKQYLDGRFGALPEVIY